DRFRRQRHGTHDAALAELEVGRVDRIGVECLVELDDQVSDRYGQNRAHRGAGPRDLELGLNVRRGRGARWADRQQRSLLERLELESRGTVPNLVRRAGEKLAIPGESLAAGGLRALHRVAPQEEN